MKLDITIPMDAQIHSIVFPNHKLKDKREILIILFEVSRYILSQYSTRDCIVAHNDGYIHLNKHRCSRLYFMDVDHCYSIGFPFTIYQNDLDVITSISFNDITLESCVFTAVIQILKSDEWNSTEILDFANPIDDWQNKRLPLEKETNFNHNNFWRFFRELMMYDVGYLRYDHSPDQFNPQCPFNHPVDHIHGGYDGNVSYRIGLSTEPTIEDIKDITNPDTDCWVLNNKKWHRGGVRSIDNRSD